MSKKTFYFQFSSVQSLSCVWLFATPRTAACQASLSITNPQNSLKVKSIKSVMPSNHLIPVVLFSSHLQSFPASGSFPMSQFFTSGGQTIGVSASTSVLPMNIQDWFSLGLTGWISLQSKGLSRVFSNTTVQRHQFFGASHFRNKETMHTVMEVPPEHPKGGCDVSDVKYWSPGLGTLYITAPQRRYYFSLVINNQFVGKHSEVR